MSTFEWITLGISLLALLISIVALRRTRQQPTVVTTPAASASTFTQTPSSGFDPALVAVLTAAVAMMMGETSQSHETSSRAWVGPTTAAGFTIRKIRRV